MSLPFILGLPVSEPCYACVSFVNILVTVLDPRISYEGLRDDFARDEDLMLDLDSSKDALNEYFQVNYANQAASLPSVAPAAASSSAQQSSPQKDFVANIVLNE
jgi:hypothetical protein